MHFLSSPGVMGSPEALLQLFGCPATPFEIHLLGLCSLVSQIHPAASPPELDRTPRVLPKVRLWLARSVNVLVLIFSHLELWQLMPIRRASETEFQEASEGLPLGSCCPACRRSSLADFQSLFELHIKAGMGSSFTLNHKAFFHLQLSD